MSEPLCRPCGDSGQSVLAHRMVGKTPMCDSHFRSAMGMPAATNGDTPMPVKKLINEGTKAAIRADAESGMSVEQIRKKHAVSWYNAKTIIDGGNGGGNGNKAAGGGGKARIAAKPARATNGHFAVALTPQGMDAVWNALQPEKKAELLGAL